MKKALTNEYFLKLDSIALSPLGFDPVWFNTDSFHKTNTSETPLVFQLIQNDIIHGIIYFYQIEKKWISGYCSTFGGFEFSSTVSIDIQKRFANEVFSVLSQKGDFPIQIKNAPSCYGIDTLNFPDHISYTDISQYIQLTDESPLHRSHKKRLRKCLDANMVFKKLSSESLTPVYEVIKQSRIRKGYPITMSYQKLDDLCFEFPERYLLFGVIHEQKIISAAVCIKINKDILYVFYMGHDANYDFFSPNVFMIDGLKTFVTENSFSILDIGISTENGVKNESLFLFKQRLGCLGSEKVCFEVFV